MSRFHVFCLMVKCCLSTYVINYLLCLNPIFVPLVHKSMIFALIRNQKVSSRIGISIVRIYHLFEICRTNEHLPRWRNQCACPPVLPQRQPLCHKTGHQKTVTAGVTPMGPKRERPMTRPQTDSSRTRLDPAGGEAVTNQIYPPVVRASAHRGDEVSSYKGADKGADPKQN